MADEHGPNGLVPTNIFVVVCTDMHVAYGPYATPDHALAVAAKLTDASKYTYVPVLFRLEQGVQIGIPVPQEEHDTDETVSPEPHSSDRHNRGYL